MEHVEEMLNYIIQCCQQNTHADKLIIREGISVIGVQDMAHLKRGAQSVMERSFHLLVQMQFQRRARIGSRKKRNYF